MSGVRIRSRGCFKCGVLTHLASECDQEGRLCYNCKQPGHESSDCQEPRSASQRQCFNCGELGHVVADCPVLQAAGLGGGTNGDRGSTVKCYACGQMGHISKNCPSASADGISPTGASSLSSSVSGPRLVKCYRCGGLNHYARDCVAPGANNTLPPRQPKICFHCHKAGHVAKLCPELRNVEASLPPPDPLPPQDSYPDVGRLSIKAASS